MPSKVCLFLFKASEKLLDYLKKGTEGLPLEWRVPEKIDNETLIELGRDAHVFIGWSPPKELLEAAEKLELFINPGVGVRHLMEPFKETGRDKTVTLVNGHGNAYFTAQHAVAMLLALMNQILPHDRWMREGKWRLGDKEARSMPLQKKRVGFLGYGHINQFVHQFLSGFELEFALLNRSKKVDNKEIKQFSSDEKQAFFEHCDIVVMALPHTDETTDFVSEQELKALGEGGLLVNVARGAVVNEDALYEALKSGTIAGAALDVWYEYKPEEKDGVKRPYNRPFHEFDQVILSPHRAASPFNDLSRWDEQIENLRRFALGERPLLNVVDFEAQY